MYVKKYMLKIKGIWFICIQNSLLNDQNTNKSYAETYSRFYV
jgi:hypothetical protein